MTRKRPIDCTLLLTPHDALTGYSTPFRPGRFNSDMFLLVCLLAFVDNLILPVGFSYTLLPSGGLVRLILDGQYAEHPANIYTYRLACVGC